MASMSANYTNSHICHVLCLSHIPTSVRYNIYASHVDLTHLSQLTYSYNAHNFSILDLSILGNKNSLN